LRHIDIVVSPCLCHLTLIRSTFHSAPNQPNIFDRFYYSTTELQLPYPRFQDVHFSNALRQRHRGSHQEGCRARPRKLALPLDLLTLPRHRTDTDVNQGTGEAIRGNVNAAVDSATGDHAAAARNQNVASRGVDEMEHGHYHGTGAGVTPVDTGRERVNRAAQGESAVPGSTNYGPHATNVGNKVDPRFDSDMDHRGTAQGSTNFGPHSTNVGNKLDPRVDSDMGTRR
jgi:hypothetical protein